METFRCLYDFLNTCLFKSYYVVWKLRNPALTAIGAYAVMFKSYYVVWKRYILIGGSGTRVLFKSYYVVWKHNSKNRNKNRK